MNTNPSRISKHLKYENTEVFAKVNFAVIPAKAGIQNRLKILDSGSRFALYTMRCRSLLARNDDFPWPSRVLQEPLRKKIFSRFQAGTMFIY